MNTKIIIFSVIFLAVIGILAVVYKQSKSEQSATQEINNNTSNIITPLISKNLDNSKLKAGGSSYTDASGIFTFLYPNDYKLDTQNNGQYTRIYKTGPTQKGETEMYDGVLMSFESINLNGKTLEQWVDSNIETTTADGTLQLTQPKKETSVNGFPGFTYKTRGLGEAEYLFLQKDSNSNFAVGITTSISDPAKMGFQDEVNLILSTLDLNK